MNYGHIYKYNHIFVELANLLEHYKRNSKGFPDLTISKHWRLRCLEAADQTQCSKKTAYLDMLR